MPPTGVGSVVTTSIALLGVTKPVRPQLPRAALSAVAVAAGLLVWTSFPPLDWWPAAIVGVAGFAWVSRTGGARAVAWRGWLFGLGFFLPLLAFLRGIGVDAWLVPAVVEAVWFAVLALATRGVAGLRWWPLATALLWVAQEWARDRVPFGGMPWGRLAFGQSDGPLLPLAALGGAVLVGFAVAGLGAMLAWLVTRLAAGTSPAGVGRPQAAGALVAVFVVGLTAPIALPTPVAGTGGPGRPARAVVAVVQGNVPRLGLAEFAQRRAVTADHLAATRALAADVAAGRVPRPQLVVWPENASDMDPFHDPTARQMIDEAVAAIGVPVLVGAVLDGPGPNHVRNTGIVWSPRTGPGQIYVKRHLVPFGEYLPFRSLMTSLVGRFSLVPYDFAAGHRPGVMTLGPARLGDVICYEVADDAVVRDVVTHGARLITVQTNNATYERVGDNGYGGETAQQLAMSKLRAVEHGRTVLVAATSGVSAVITPDGRVRQRSGVFRPATLVADVPLRDPRTVADRLGAWPERALTVAAALMWLVALARRRRPGVGAGSSATPDVPLTAASR